MPNIQLNLYGTPDELPPIVNRVLPDCVDESQCICPNCSEEFPGSDGYEIDSEIHCPDCVVHCEECNDAHVVDDGTIGDASCGYSWQTGRETSRMLCDDCAFVCADCNDRFDNAIDNFSNTSNDRVCPSCGGNYYSCDNCGEVLHGEDIRGNDEGCYCQGCYRDDNDDDSLIKSYEYKPSPEFRRAVDETTASMYFGVELEIDGGGENPDNVESSGLADDSAFYAKHDGSLRDGFEIVSHPGTFKWWMAHSLPFLPKLSRLGYRSYETTTCGMHVHVSRDALSVAEIARLAKFFRNSADFIFKVSRRASQAAMNSWAKIDGSDDITLEHKAANRRNCDRYEALNLTGSSTIEFRLFRGTIDIPAIKRNLAFTYTLCEYARTTGGLNAQAYVEWLKDNAQRIIGDETLANSLVEWLGGLL